MRFGFRKRKPEVQRKLASAVQFIEVLENRKLLTVTVTTVGTFATVAGDATAQTIRLVQNGSLIEVYDNLNLIGSTSASHITVNAGSGSDTVNATGITNTALSTVSQWGGRN